MTPQTKMWKEQERLIADAKRKLCMAEMVLLEASYPDLPCQTELRGYLVSAEMAVSCAIKVGQDGGA